MSSFSLLLPSSVPPSLLPSVPPSSRQLALEIAKLKIYQESLELRELEEDNQVTFL